MEEKNQLDQPDKVGFFSQWYSKWLSKWLSLWYRGYIEGYKAGYEARAKKIRDCSLN